MRQKNTETERNQDGSNLPTAFPTATATPFPHHRHHLYHLLWYHMGDVGFGVCPSHRIIGASFL